LINNGNTGLLTQASEAPKHRAAALANTDGGADGIASICRFVNVFLLSADRQLPGGMRLFVQVALVKGLNMKLKQVLLASTICVLPFAASAADLPVKAPIRVVQPIPFTWTGFYVGASAGFISQNTRGDDRGNTNDGDGLINNIGDTYGIPGVGGLFGGNIGYNWQFAPNWVVGIEADIAWSGVNDSFSVSSFNGIGTGTYSSKLDYLGTVRGRIGYAFDRALLYATGGFAYGGVKNSAGNGPNRIASTSETQTGWTVGGGLEYAFTNNWTARVEALYVDLGSSEGTTTSVLSSCRFGFKNTYTLGRFGLNYKF
jgi:outer membrane immunogenic protein